MKDLYEILGVQKNATEKEIKVAYKKGALRTHPDKQQGKSEEEKKKAEEEFKEISKAYEILSDKDKKARYDNFGIIDDEPGGGGGGAGFDPFEQFAQFFRGGNFGGGGFGYNPYDGYNRGPAPGGDMQMRISLNIEDIYSGCKKKVKYYKNIRCKSCHGTGGEGKEQCRYCHGTGMFTKVQHTQFGISSTSSPCPYCNASGYSIKHRCTSCNGTGFDREENILTVEFKPGIGNNNAILFKGEGHESASPEGANGNFIAIADWQIDTSRYFIENYDLYEKISIPWNICIAGGDWEITLPDGVKKTIQVPECTRPDSICTKLKNYGIGHKGNYIVLAEYKLPQKLPNDVKKILKDIKC